MSVQPILRRGARLALYLAVCLTVGGLLAAALAGRSQVQLWQAAVVVMPLAVLYGFVCLSSSYVCRATPLRTSSPATVAANVGGSAVVAGIAWLGLTRATAWMVGSVPWLAGVDRLFAGEALLLFIVGALVYLLTIASHYVVLGMDEARAAEQQALEARLLAREAELKMLRAQIEPHFLFNSLNSISALTSTDPPRARQMCVLLGEFLRASLKLRGEERIRLEDEVALATRFFDIERVRYGARLQFEQAIEAEAARCLVPPLLLQPLAENAVSHGIAQLLEGGTVRLEATRRNGVLRITIENPFDTDRAARDRAGVGLDNVRRRLATHYGGGQATLEARAAGSCFRVTMSMPAVEG